ncbi:MAG: chromosome segregation protein SMC [Acidimicrobiia bacterium]|nr:chromosome segregation protein SMC [Acidimicrobiia bacterium]
MFLKSLTLKGFKSFAEHTSLDFEPGVTIVVGPNGSGKSNLVDAVAWVLGAQGARALRGSKMDDVIFAGSGNKAPLGRAEVSLTIDNSSGLLPIAFTEVTITRTLFRESGESEYAINGAPCRLLDIQELLSDSGVGRTQHVIVSQGQLDSVLQARPEDRRAVIEEAAGVLKYRRRKEKAERRLAATESNLLRLQDLLREVRRQLRPLERQADAARRHGEVAGELAALRLHLAGREVSAFKGRAETAASSKAAMETEERQLRTRLAELDRSVAAAEAALSATDASGLGDIVGRAEALRERARGQAALLAERRRSLERDRSAFVDHTLVAALEAEAARVTGELAEVDSAARELVPEADGLATAEADLAREREEFEARLADGVPSPSGQAAEVRGELSALRASVELGQSEMGRLEARLDALQQRADRLTAATERLESELRDAEAAERGLVAAVDEAAARKIAAQAAADDAESTRRNAETEHRALLARVDALTLALEAASPASASAALGVLGDLVEIDAGWETAVVAALGDALGALVVRDADDARAALASLAASGGIGTVTAGLTPATAVSMSVPGGEPVRHHVRSRDAAVATVLDGLLAGHVVIGGDWEEALDAALAHPQLTIVTRAGDRFGGGAWRLGASRTGVTAAALDDARQRAAQAADTLTAATTRAAEAAVELDNATTEATEANRRLDENDGGLTAAADALRRLETEKRDVAVEGDAVRVHLDELAERIGREGARVAQLEDVLPTLEAEEAAGAERLEALRTARERLEERLAAVGTLRTGLEVRAASVEVRKAELSRRLAELEERLARHAHEREQAQSQRERLERLLAHTDRISAFVADRLALLEGRLAGLRRRRQEQSEAAAAAASRLDAVRAERSAAERRLEEVREKARRAELDEAEARMRLEAAVETVRREFDCEPEVAVAAECPPLPPATSAEARGRELERELRLMGPINPLALEEFTALQERHSFLEGQLDDVKSSRRELGKVIKAVDAEIVQLFAAAFADVADNFSKLFETLFPGGTGRIRLTDPDDPLNTGIEVEARPHGKNVRKLSLLSGGERSLTALAFLFAVFRSRPSPFYLLDEVEAALDDVNLHRFIDLVHEFRDEAQLLVVTHQKRTMEAGDLLYGVTMQPGGSSRVISQRVKSAL